MNRVIKILIAEHDKNDLQILENELINSGLHYVSKIVQTEKDYTESLESFTPDIILSDYTFPSFDGPTAFKIREELAPLTPFILVSGTVGEEVVVELIKSGVTDYALKDKLFTLPNKIDRALRDSDKAKQVIKDIIERKLSDESLIQSEERLKEAQTISHISHWEIDLITGVNIWSDEFYNILMVKPEDITPSPESFLSLIHPDDIHFAKNTMEKAFKTLEEGFFNARTKEKNGVIRQLFSKWKFEFDKNNKPIRLFGILQDITERKLAEAEKEKMISDIIQRSKNLEQFTYIISHNLRAPIANILGIANVLKGNVTDHDRSRIQQFLFTAVEKLDDTVKDLNKILQIRSEITESKESVDLLELVQVIKSSIQNLIQKENAQILTDFSFINKLTTIKSYLHSIFYNLIANAIKYKHPDKAPIIQIKSYTHNNKTFISFKDNGTGIDLEQHGDKVFGLYKRFHENIEGKGLGLFMVKTQMEVLGGSISVKSENGTGTEFIIEFPN